MNQNIFDLVRIAVLAILLGTALYTDLRFGKIYNKLTLPCIAIGLALNLAHSGPKGLLLSAAGAGLVMALFLFFAPMAGIGGGDTKLMMAVGALLGLVPTVWAMLFSAVIGGVLALVVMTRYRAMLSTTRNMAMNIYLSAVLRAPLELTSGSRGIKFRYSPAIALGTLLAVLFKG
jgi:prepilin peptidase CpaA